MLMMDQISQLPEEEKATYEYIQYLCNPLLVYFIFQDARPISLVNIQKQNKPDIPILLCYCLSMTLKRNFWKYG